MTARAKSWMNTILIAGLTIFMALVGIIYSNLKDDLDSKVEAARYESDQRAISEKFDYNAQEYIYIRKAIEDLRYDFRDLSKEIRAHDRRVRP